jgi:DeoR family fructose operon transcriptional repressor
MLSLQRREEILAILKVKKSATVEELSKELFVSGATIRRDLREMEQSRLLKRSHGGAMLYSSKSEESPFAVREQENIAAKKTIANLAIKFISNGQALFVDSSTTSGVVMPMLNQFKYLSVTTIGLRNALTLTQSNNIKIYIAGGLIENHSNTITGADSMDFIKRIHADVAMVSCMGVDIENGFTDTSIEQAKIKQQMRKNSKILIMLCDSTKFNKTYMCTDFSFDDVDYLITDTTPPIEFVEKIAQTKCKLITPQNTNY